MQKKPPGKPDGFFSAQTLFCYVWKESHEAGALDREGKSTLVLGGKA